MEIVLTVNQVEINENKGSLIKIDEVPFGAEVEFKKRTGLLDDYLIEASIGDKILGYVFDVPVYLIKDTQILNKELYDQLPDHFYGILDKKLYRSGAKNDTSFSVKINNLELETI